MLLFGQKKATSPRVSHRLAAFSIFENSRQTQPADRFRLRIICLYEFINFAMLFRCLSATNIGGVRGKCNRDVKFFFEAAYAIFGSGI